MREKMNFDDLIKRLDSIKEDPNEMDDVVVDAINVAIKHIQDHLGETDGGFAGDYFSDDSKMKPLKDILLDYALAQKQQLNK